MPPQPRTNASKFMVELYQILGDWGIFWGKADSVKNYLEKIQNTY